MLLPQIDFSTGDDPLVPSRAGDHRTAPPLLTALLLTDAVNPTRAMVREKYSVDKNKIYELYYICRKLRRSSERAWRGGMREVPAGHAIVSLDGQSWKRARRDGKRVRSSAAVCQSQRRLAEATIGTATPVQHPADRLGEVLSCRGGSVKTS